MELLRNEFGNVKAWADSFVDARNEMSAADLSTSEHPLKDDAERAEDHPLRSIPGADVRRRCVPRMMRRVTSFLTRDKHTFPTRCGQASYVADVASVQQRQDTQKLTRGHTRGASIAAGGYLESRKTRPSTWRVCAEHAESVNWFLYSPTGIRKASFDISVRSHPQ